MKGFSRKNRIFKYLGRFLSVFLALNLLFSDISWGAYQISARSAIFSNSTKQKRYYGKYVHRRVRVASTTKVMTALLVLEKLPLNKVVRVSRRATYVQPSKINVREGERYRVRDLLYALMLSSANDVAVVLAEAVAGSQEAFVNMMNQRARQLGARQTKFVNPHGLPNKQSDQYSTAYDMYLIFRQAIKSPFFRHVVKVKTKTILSVDGRRIALKSHNKILFANWNRHVWGKTGWTRRAKQCFIGYFMKGKDVYIIGVFGASQRWKDIKYIVERYGGIFL